MRDLAIVIVFAPLAAVIAAGVAVGRIAEHFEDHAERP